MTSPLRDDREWLRAYAGVQTISDAEVLRIIQDSYNEVRRQIAIIETAARGTISDRIRIEQMRRIQAALMREQALVFRRLGNVIRAARLEAAARALSLGNTIDALAFERAGRLDLARDLARGLTMGLERTLQVALSRMELSRIPLAEHVYRARVWMDGRLQAGINSALARGLTAAEFAAEARDWINPNTPGGVRYAAMRLARSEINNAFHAMSMHQAQEKPWVEAMKWHLSRSHPKADQCDEYANEDKFGRGAGVFPKADVPRKPHPHCFCFVTPALVGEDEFLDALTGGSYDRYIDHARPGSRATEESRQAISGSGDRPSR